jgi:hypothetical protein
LNQWLIIALLNAWMNEYENDWINELVNRENFVIGLWAKTPDTICKKTTEFICVFSWIILYNESWHFHYYCFCWRCFCWFISILINISTQIFSVYLTNDCYTNDSSWKESTRIILLLFCKVFCFIICKWSCA